jgi:site-specific recombinase XerD
MGNARLKLVSPTAVNRTMPLRRPNSELRTREHLTEAEVERLIEAAKHNRQGHRDSTMLLLAYRHGCRAREICELRWDQVSFETAVLHVRRVKRGIPSTHPLTGRELRALRKLQRQTPPSPFVFVSNRGAPMSPAGFARMIERAAKVAGLTELKPHPHCLRHSCGFALGSRGVDLRTIQGWLGHANVRHSAIYVALSPNRFRDIWRD